VVLRTADAVVATSEQVGPGITIMDNAAERTWEARLETRPVWTGCTEPVRRQGMSCKGKWRSKGRDAECGRGIKEEVSKMPEILKWRNDNGTH